MIVDGRNDNPTPVREFGCTRMAGRLLAQTGSRLRLTIVDTIPPGRHDSRLKDTHGTEAARSTIIEVGGGNRWQLDLRT